MNIQPLMREQLPAVRAFFAQIPAGDLTFAKEQPDEPGLLDRWLRDARTLRLLALDAQEKAVIGYAAVIPGMGLSRHVGELRLVVAPEQRRCGVGKALARQALIEAISGLGLRKVVVEVVAEQEPAIRMFRGLGFVAEAILVDHLLDHQDQSQDLILLAHFVADNQGQLAALGVTEALT